MRTCRGLVLGLLAGLLLTGPSSGAAGDPADVSVEPTKDHIDFRAGKALVVRYVIDPRYSKPYFWPVHAPLGAALTRPWPMAKLEPGEKADHPHHRSIWFCHGDVSVEGLESKVKSKHGPGIDFWTEVPGHGQIVCTRVADVKQGKNHGQVTTFNEWQTIEGKKVLEEKRTIHLYDFGKARLLVVDIDLHASVAPVTFGDTKEGSFGVRVRDRMRVDKGKGKLTNAEGKSGEGKRGNASREGCWGLISAWCDYSGPLEGGTAGIALLADPSNAYPTAWHSRNYGLMAANPFGRRKSGFPDMKGRSDLVKLGKGEHLKLRYGVLLHDGDVKEGKVAEYYEQFRKLRETEGKK